MQKVVMYGKGAVQILHGKETLKAVDGMISVPPELVGRMEKLGYSTAPRGGDETTEEPIAKIEPSKTDDGAPDTDSAPTIGGEYQERLEALIAEGVSEEDARQVLAGADPMLPPLE